MYILRASDYILNRLIYTNINICICVYMCKGKASEGEREREKETSFKSNFATNYWLCEL